MEVKVVVVCLGRKNSSKLSDLVVLLGVALLLGIWQCMVQSVDSRTYGVVNVMVKNVSRMFMNLEELCN